MLDNVRSVASTACLNLSHFFRSLHDYLQSSSTRIATTKAPARGGANGFSIFDLPAELRNQIYSEYLKAHSGHMRIKSLSSFSWSCCSLLHSLDALDQQLKNMAREHPLEPIPQSTGPANLLSTNKTIYKEFCGMFMSSTVFSFNSSASLGYFVQSYKASGELQHVKSITIDLTKFCIAQELETMIKQANQIPTLFNLEVLVHIRNWNALGALRRPTLQGIREAMLARSTLQHLRAKNVSVRDPRQEAEFQNALERVYAEHGASPRRFGNKLQVRLTTIQQYMEHMEGLMLLHDFNAELRDRMLGASTDVPEWVRWTKVPCLVVAWIAQALTGR